jgi:hypothetical protein
VVAASLGAGVVGGNEATVGAGKEKRAGSDADEGEDGTEGPNEDKGSDVGVEEGLGARAPTSTSFGMMSLSRRGIAAPVLIWS